MGISIIFEIVYSMENGQTYFICVSNNANFRRYDFTIEYVSHMTTVFPCNLVLNSLRYPMMSVANANFHSHSLFDNSGCGQFFSFRKISIISLSSKNLNKTFPVLIHRTAVW